MKVFIKDKTSFLHFRYQKVFSKAANSLEEIVSLKKPSEVNVVIVSEEEIKELSKIYRNKDKITDVLSFPNDFKNLSKQINYYMLGDVFLCKKVIKKQGKKFRHGYKREITYLFVHGLLHLLGYNHIEQNQEKQMNKLAEKVMKEIGVLRNVK